MFPTVFEFRWDAGHMIFFGAFYSVVIVVLTSLLFVAARSVTEVYRDMKSNGKSNGEASAANDVAENAVEVSEKK
ncbi:MAG: hypothetical protein C4520_01445 [Candidatus Abyssobacteria bacterium SURF_5]|jgi:cation transport regulator ChaB|uniref:Uncharacterized protein n=1 Tax=Abyssobacteria bacterium (strain SURF_5) TaxID=2093360 RepID=A0A3A4NZP9_ABYX5|nr:MAG: hypothetical protein C4520_01445 [Candidatus Abyssubacteria bacterium SURF_5]